jgi:lysophospholipase L1-like esterase
MWSRFFLLGGAAAVAAEITVPVSDANFYFTDYNWFETGGGAVSAGRATSNPGATTKLGFANSSYATILLNTSRLAPAPAPYVTLKLAASVDDGPWQLFQLSAANRSAPGGDMVELTLAASDVTRPAHEVVLTLFASTQMTDRWLGGGGTAGSSYLEVSGARLDSGGFTVRPASLRAHRMLFYGDSISEGTNAHFFDWRGPGTCVGGNEMQVNCAPCSWGQVLSRALDAEPSQVAFAAAGYSTHASLQYGNVPPLLTVGANASSSSWDKIDAAHSRLDALRQRPPEYVFSAHGQNDQACGSGMAGHGRCTFDMVTAAVTAWLGAMRAATSPETRIVVIVPFGGSMGGDQNRTRTAIRDGYDSYQAAAAAAPGSGTVTDPHAYLIDLYPAAERGLSGSGGKATVASCDGVHPLAHTHAQLASMLAIEFSKQQVQRSRSLECERPPLQLQNKRL